MRFGTKAIHAGQPPEPRTGAVAVPIFLSATYSQAVGREGYEYSRTQNPTREALEANLAALEGGTHGVAFASGMSAITALMTLLKKGDHVVVADDVYGGTQRLFRQVLADYGLRFTFVDFRDLSRVEAAVEESTRMLWAETPTNPLLRLVDLQALAELGAQADLWTVVDSTFGTPYLQRPLELGVDVVVHSTTKYLAGHSDIIGGAVVTSREEVHDRVRFSQNALGAVPSPFDCFLTLRGIKTLPLRMERHCANARAVADLLDASPTVVQVYYPGLPSHPQHALAKAQMRDFGGMVSFALASGAQAQAFLKALDLIILGESLGGVESLIEHPATMTHASVPQEEREARGIGDGFVRFSVGCEDVEDLKEDLEKGLTAGAR